MYFRLNDIQYHGIRILVLCFCCCYCHRCWCCCCCYLLFCLSVHCVLQRDELLLLLLAAVLCALATLHFTDLRLHFVCCLMIANICRHAYQFAHSVNAFWCAIIPMIQSLYRSFCVCVFVCGNCCCCHIVSLFRCYFQHVKLSFPFRVLDYDVCESVWLSITIPFVQTIKIGMHLILLIWWNVFPTHFHHSDSNTIVNISTRNIFLFSTESIVCQSNSLFPIHFQFIWMCICGFMTFDLLIKLWTRFHRMNMRRISLVWFSTMEIPCSTCQGRNSKYASIKRVEQS